MSASGLRSLVCAIYRGPKAARQCRLTRHSVVCKPCDWFSNFRYVSTLGHDARVRYSWHSMLHAEKLAEEVISIPRCA